MTTNATIGDQEVEMDRRLEDRRSGHLAETEAATGVEATDETPVATEFNAPRRKAVRRRQIDPTTCERDYNGEEIEFMQALDAYKRSSGRMFPTCSEILEVIRDLGYVRLSEEQLAEFVGDRQWDAEQDTEDAVDDELAAELDEVIR